MTLIIISTSKNIVVALKHKICIQITKPYEQKKRKIIFSKSTFQRQCGINARWWVKDTYYFRVFSRHKYIIIHTLICQLKYWTMTITYLPIFLHSSFNSHQIWNKHSCLHLEFNITFWPWPTYFRPSKIHLNVE